MTLEPARARGLGGARPRRVPVRDPAPAGRRRRTARVIVMGQEAEVFARHGIGPLDDWTPLEAPARRRRWYDDGHGTMAVLLASASDLDDLVPTLVAYQIEWNKLRAAAAHARLAAGGRRARRRRVRGGARRVGGRLAAAAEAWGDAFAERGSRVAARAAQPAHPDARRQRGRLRAHDAPLVGAGARRAGRAGARRPPDVLRLLQPALDRQPRLRHRAPARGRDHALGGDRRARRPARGARRASATGRTEGSWENFLYFSARDFFEAHPAALKERRAEEERAVGLTHISSRTALRVSRADHRARLARPALAGPAAGRRRRRPARPLPRR